MSYWRSVAMASIVSGLSVGLASGSALGGLEQKGEPSAVHGEPVEGHDITAGVEIVGTKLLRDLGPLKERFRDTGAVVILGRPLEFPTLCRFKEVLLDVLAEKGVPNAEITHETRPTFGNPRYLTIKFTVVEGPRSAPRRGPPPKSPAERCSR